MTQENQQENEEVLQVGYEFIPKGRHEYRQRGPYLVCMSCEIQHATHIGVNKVMIGVDEDGQPILKKR